MIHELLVASSRVLRRHDPLMRSWLSAPNALSLAAQHREIIAPLVAGLNPRTASGSGFDGLRDVTARLFGVFHDDESLVKQPRWLPPSFADAFEFRAAFQREFGAQPAVLAGGETAGGLRHNFAAMRDVDVPFGVSLVRLRRRDRKERQLRRLARVVQTLRRDSGALQVVDIGGGAGRLGAYLAGDFAVPVVVVDKSRRLLQRSSGDGINSGSAQQLLRTVHDEIDLARLVANIDSPAVVRHALTSRAPVRNALAKPCCLVGVHACGSLSDAVLAAAASLPTVVSFLVVPCCPHHKLAALPRRQQEQDAVSQQTLVNTVFFSQLGRREADCGFASVLTDSTAYAKAYLLMANLHHMMPWAQFEQWAALKALHHGHELLAAKHPEFSRSVPSSASVSLRLLGDFFAKGTQRDAGATSCGCSLVGSEDQHLTTSVAGTNAGAAAAMSHIFSRASFAEYVRLLQAATAQQGTVSTPQQRNLSPQDMEFLDAFFAAHFASEIQPAIALKCAVDSVASVIESAVLLDRAQFMLEHERLKWRSLVCGSLFSASTTPRRFAIWGVRDTNAQAALLLA